MRKQELIWLDTAENPEGQMELTIKYRESTNEENVAAFLEIRDKNSVLVKEKGELKQDTARVKTAVFKCQGVLCWTPDNPALYQVNIVLELSDKNNEKTYIRHGQKLGFRSLKRQNQQVFWNHKPVKLLGICYREPDSKMENWETVLRRDLELFKAAHVNFIRGIYYPFSEKMLELCDEMGFWVENTAPFYELGQTKKNISELPHMQKEFETAAEELLANGSHTSVLLWSLGHDCAWGVNFGIIRDRIRELDDIRLMTFHLPMSIPEEEPQMDVWPVHDIDWRLPFDKTYDQMVIFHTPGAENEIGYMIADADYPVPVLHEVWSPVVCHNRDEIQRDPGIRDFWGKSIHTFVEKSARTPGCLGGAVLAGVDEDGSFEGLKEYEWGILDVNHNPKPEYYHL
ncbi:MAG: glycoside hydrolase family 2 TIM barrel-domain containing protein, partial [Blautia sp.]|nr:glycoside hydrolase family 2 TIM barrel-domain containing protein [Blautia sp.]